MELLEVVKYDLIVLGTGLEESLLASAAAKVGKTVLHLDPAAHYGTHWAGLQLDTFLDWAHASQGAAENPVAHTENPEPASVSPDATQKEWLEVAVCSNVGAGPSGLYHDVWIWSDPSTDLGLSRSYSIDLAPKVAFCAGPLIETLLQSGAHNYVEFKLLQGSYIWQGGRLQPVPASKGDVFRSRSLSPSDKRLLMRFLKACSDAMEGQGHLVDAFGRQPFLQLLQTEGLSENLQNIVLYAIAMCDSDQHAALVEIAEKNSSTQTGADHAQAASDEAIGHGQQQQHVSSNSSAQSARVEDTIAMTGEEGWRALQLYMASTGKYAAGGSAFMALVYGVGELSQAFCRVAAVAGATYVLRHPVSTILLDPITRCCVGVRTAAGQILSCEALAADTVSLAGLDHIASSTENRPSITSADEPCKAPVKRSIARAVCIIVGPLQDGESQVLVVIPPGALAGINTPVRVLQVGSATCSTPEGRYLLYLSTPATPNASAAQSLSAVVDALVQIPPDGRGPAGVLPSDGVNQSTSSVEGADSGASPCTYNLSAEFHGHHQLRSTAGADSGRKECPGGKSSLMDVRPKALMVVYYLQDWKSIRGAELPQNIARCSPPDISLGFATILEDASSSFQRLYPSLNPSFLDTSEGTNKGEESDEDTVEQLHSALASAILGEQ